MGRRKQMMMAFLAKHGLAPQLRPPPAPPAQPPMDLDSFCAAVQAMQVHWRLSGSPQMIRTVVGADCLITAVTRHLTGWRFPLGGWEEAARAIRLPIALAEELVRAADESRPHDSQLRRRLLEATGLLPKPDEMDRELSTLLAEAKTAPPLHQPDAVEGRELAAV